MFLGDQSNDLTHNAVWLGKRATERAHPQGRKSCSGHATAHRVEATIEQRFPEQIIQRGARDGGYG